VTEKVRQTDRQRACGGEGSEREHACDAGGGYSAAGLLDEGAVHPVMAGASERESEWESETNMCIQRGRGREREGERGRERERRRKRGGRERETDIRKKEEAQSTMW
jgi:hypothetical protein